MAEPIISVSGLRGIVGETLTPEVAVRYAAAFAALAPPGTILVGRDSRPSGEMLSEAIQAGLQAAGRTTLDAGILATPTVGVLVRHCQAAGGIAVTASHNPLPYNGIKLFSAEGRVAAGRLGPAGLDALSRGRGPRVPSPTARHAADRGRPAFLPPRKRSWPRWTPSASAAAVSRSCWIPTAGRAARWAAGCSRRWAAA